MPPTTNRRRHNNPSKQYNRPKTQMIDTKLDSPSGSEPPYSNVPEANPLETQNLPKSTLDVRSSTNDDPSFRFGPSGSLEIQEFPNQLPVGLAPPAGVEYESDEDYVTLTG